LEAEETTAVKNREREINRRYRYVAKFLSQQDYDRKIARAQMEFLDEHGDPELWEDHLKGLGIGKKSYGAVDHALVLWAERELDPVGKSLNEVFVAARGWGMFDEKKSSWDNSYSIPPELNLGWIVPAPPVSDDDE
jgi:hypothetical protein